MTKKIIGNDLVNVLNIDQTQKKIVTKLAMGDEVEIIEEIHNYHKIKLNNSGLLGLIHKRVRLIDPSQNNILKVSFVDVQEGDATIIETPRGNIIIIDAGENKLLARYLAGRYKGTSYEKPLQVDTMIVTHGDADHFSGLNEILKSEKHEISKKRIFIHPKRIYHNGITVRRSNKVHRGKNFGKIRKYNDRYYITELVDDFTKLDREKLNSKFSKWASTIDNWRKSGPITVERLSYGDDIKFSHLRKEGIVIKVISPFPETKQGKSVLPLLRKPLASGYSFLNENWEAHSSYSATHTINGHSIALQLIYNNVRFLFTGDITSETQSKLVGLANRKKLILRSEIFKVPHHGSADFSKEFLKRVSPAISIISSGGDTVLREYIHPRSILIGSLGKYSRTTHPLIFITELSAFFSKIGKIKVTSSADAESKEVFAFKREQFGIVHVRTDGNRILVFTHSGKRSMKEAYALKVKNCSIKLDTLDLA